MRTHVARVLRVLVPTTFALALAVGSASLPARSPTAAE